ncbi:TonB-dependent receptor [Microcoleus sp. SVA1_B6]|uniref:TonB-dependent receptor domain-containing protein n=1 Tax=Microcoleus sp. SVA1_B6 TaxID=2818952 RepID=UPI002FD599B7
MKLYLSWACVALLSIGIAPSVAAEAAKEDLTESERSIAPSTIEIHRESEKLPQQEPAIATGLQPELSLYASYSRSFNPDSATTAGGGLIEPETGSGYEVGVKAELLDRRLAATVAYFDIKKQNVAVTDPNNLLFSIASGEQRSRGLEFDISGQIVPGWNIIAAYAYTDAEITADTDRDLVGNRLFNVPKHSGSLWTTYEIQSGDLQGLGFGVGFSYVGERQGDLSNSFQADSYFLPNAAVFYQRDNWRAAINIKNLFNVNYMESITGSRASGNQPGEPLTVIASFTVQL